MKMCPIRFLSFLAILALTTNAPTYAQYQGATEWSTQIWVAASDGHWDTVTTLLNNVPEGEEVDLQTFKSQLKIYREHRDTEQLETTKARDEAIVEMNSRFKNGNTLQAMQSAVKAQTLSNTLDEIMYNEDVQAVLSQAQRDVASLDQSENILTAQTLLYYLRTFYEGTSRRDLYELWNDQLEEVALQVSLLRQYAPEHLHKLFVARAVILGDEPPEDYTERAADNWVERVNGIDESMIIRALTTAVSEHINGVEWDDLIRGGLKSVRKLGEIPIIEESFNNASDSRLQALWIDGVNEELDTYPQYLEHISGKRLLTQIFKRLLALNTTAMELPRGMILREFGDGAMGKLDKYSTIIWPDESRRFQQQTEGSFVGIGISIQENTKGEIMVVKPIEGTPAYYGKVQPDDVILAVNGKSASGWSLNDAVDRITGPPGTAVSITIRRKTEEEPITITLTRNSIKLHSVHGWWKKDLDEEGQPNWGWYIDPTNKIGYIKLSNFSDESYSDMLSAVREMQEEGEPNGLILDLRYNPGGLLPTARQISNLFVSSGTIVSGETANGDELFRMRARPNRAYLSDWPVIILINQGSASASEIVAGCVQAHDAGIIVGQRSWGKGSVQTVHQIGIESYVKLTTQTYRLPSPDGGETPGRLVHKRRGSTDWGVIPDVEVTMSPDQITKSNKLRQEADLILPNPTIDERPDINDLITLGLDPQLETALLLLRANIVSRMISDHQHASID
ncbi:MAG: S41 family peptidase [Phycisphaerae bacterium]|nr:S41 family peptidase [Phycisphaerae bacterium]MBT6283479.1 S41 family peptidase [Phycisphaerae bacterium]